MQRNNRYRFISHNEQQNHGYSETRIYCVDPDGYPFILGNQFVIWAIEQGNVLKTVLDYLSNVLILLSYFFTLSPKFSFLSSCKEIRSEMNKYIRNTLGFPLKFPKNQVAIIEVPQRRSNSYVIKTKISPSTLKQRIHSWKAFYDFLIKANIYSDNNPFEWKNGITKNISYPRQMPTISGMSIERISYGRGNHRDINTYYCVVEGNWEPKQISDPELQEKFFPVKSKSAQEKKPRKRRTKIGKKKRKPEKLFLRKGFRVVAKILFKGPRIHEVLAATIGDLRICQGKNILGISAINKGGKGIPEKIIAWGSDIQRELINYINSERKEFDKLHREFGDLPDDAPIFLNRLGNRMTYWNFYLSWIRACEILGIKCTIHQVRHWFVTRCLTRINTLVDDDQKAAWKKKFEEYMAWKSKETVNIYDHTDQIYIVDDDDLYRFLQTGQLAESSQCVPFKKEEPKSDVMSEKEITMLRKFQSFLDQEL